MLPYPLLGLVGNGVRGCVEDMVGVEGVGIWVGIFLKKKKEKKRAMSMDSKADSGIVVSLCGRVSERGRMMRIRKRNNIKRKKAWIQEYVV